MTKEELIHLTLKQLSESLTLSPENFRLEDPALGNTNGSFPGPTIIWQFKIKVEEEKYIQDPMNSTKTVIVTYNKLAKQLQCYLYNREVNTLSHSIMSDAQSTVTYHEHLSPWMYRTYRQFRKISKELIKRKNEKEYMDYVKRLSAIFPTTHDDDLFN